jgi:hypothetical protein
MRLRLFACTVVLTLGLTAAAQQITVEVSPAFQAHIAELSAFAEARRELSLPAPLPLHFPNRAELRDYLNRQLEIGLTQDDLDRALRFYAAFGWMPIETDLRGLFEEFYTSQVGGFYDTETKEMNVVILSGRPLGDRLPIIEQIVYVHEYVHALQDAAFDLLAYLTEMQALENQDEQLARLALVEGDATLVMNEYAVYAAQRNPLGTLTGLLLGGLQAGNLTLPPGIPSIIASELLFPYIEGEAFVRALFNEGGWELVNAAFSRPPQTTEQILHPEKYLAGEVGVRVRLLDSAAKLGAGWQLIDQGVLGEFHLREFLSKELTAAQAAQAAAGWGGSAYHIYQHGDGRLAVMLRLEWDTPDDLAEFQTAINAYGESRFGTSADGGCFSNADAALCSNGRMVLIAPTVDLALSMISE